MNSLDIIVIIVLIILFIIFPIPLIFYLEYKCGKSDETEIKTDNDNKEP